VGSVACRMRTQSCGGLGEPLIPRLGFGASSPILLGVISSRSTVRGGGRSWKAFFPALEPNEQSA